MRKSADVVVIGGGVMGCSILYNLAQRGVRGAVLLEQEVIGWGSSSRGNAILRTHYSNEVTTRLARDSLEIFGNLAEIVGDDCGFASLGWLLAVGQEDRMALERNVAMQRSLGLRAEVIDADDAGEIVPGLHAREGDAFAFEPDAGTANPYRVTTAYARRAVNLGAAIETGVRVLGIDAAGDRVHSVRTSHGIIDTPCVVVATGPWSARLFKELGVFTPFVPVRHAIVALRFPSNAPRGLPTVNDVTNAFSARPEGEVSLVGVGEDELADPDKYDQGVSGALATRTLGAVTARMPFMARATIAGGWAGLFTTTPDWHPVLGSVPPIEGLYCATGFSGHGFKLSPMVGKVMAELVTGVEETTVNVSQLALARFAAGQLLSSNYRMRVLA